MPIAFSFVKIFNLYKFNPIFVVELWRLLGGRADQLLEDFDCDLCHELYEDWRTTSNPSPSRSDNVGIIKYNYIVCIIFVPDSQTVILRVMLDIITGKDYRKK